jgi:hypothetical protein
VLALNRRAAGPGHYLLVFEDGQFRLERLAFFVNDLRDVRWVLVWVWRRLGGGCVPVAW